MAVVTSESIDAWGKLGIRRHPGSVVRRIWVFAFSYHKGTFYLAQGCS
jgi:hypothetical protein